MEPENPNRRLCQKREIYSKSRKPKGRESPLWKMQTCVEFNFGHGHRRLRSLSLTVASCARARVHPAGQPVSVTFISRSKTRVIITFFTGFPWNVVWTFAGAPEEHKMCIFFFIFIFSFSIIWNWMSGKLERHGHEGHCGSSVYTFFY